MTNAKIYGNLANHFASNFHTFTLASMPIASPSPTTSAKTSIRSKPTDAHRSVASGAQPKKSPKRKESKKEKLTHDFTTTKKSILRVRKEFFLQRLSRIYLLKSEKTQIHFKAVDTIHFFYRLNAKSAESFSYYCE